MAELEIAELEIIGAPQSNYVRALRMLCEEKGVGYKLNPARPHTPDVTAISPTGQIPCMRHGDARIFESLAIATYIDKAFAGPRFIPDDALGAARVMQWVSYGNVKVDRWIMREFVVPTAFASKELGPDTARIAAAIPEIRMCLGVLEAAVRTTGYLAGPALTFADMNVLPMLETFKFFPEGQAVLASFPGVLTYMAGLAARPSFTKTAPPPRAR